LISTLQSLYHNTSAITVLDAESRRRVHQDSELSRQLQQLTINPDSRQASVTGSTRTKKGNIPVHPNTNTKKAKTPVQSEVSTTAKNTKKVSVLGNVRDALQSHHTSKSSRKP